MAKDLPPEASGPQSHSPSFGHSVPLPAYVLYAFLAGLPMVLPGSWVGAIALWLMLAVLAVPLYRSAQPISVWYAAIGWMAAIMISTSFAQFYFHGAPAPHSRVAVGNSSPTVRRLSLAAQELLRRDLELASDPQCSVTLYHSGGEEAANYAGDFAEVFLRAGWTVSPGRPPTTMLPGIELRTDGGDDLAEPFMGHLWQFDRDIERHPYPAMVRCKWELRIGDHR